MNKEKTILSLQLCEGNNNTDVNNKVTSCINAQQDINLQNVCTMYKITEDRKLGSPHY